jgi:hypothetical protein
LEFNQQPPPSKYDGKEFLGAINALGHMKDAVYIVHVIKRYVIEVGPQNVVEIYMNNANVMHKAISIVQEDCSHLYFQGYMAHALNHYSKIRVYHVGHALWLKMLRR